MKSVSRARERINPSIQSIRFGRLPGKSTVPDRKNTGGRVSAINRSITFFTLPHTQIISSHFRHSLHTTQYLFLFESSIDWNMKFSALTLLYVASSTTRRAVASNAGAAAAAAAGGAGVHVPVGKDGEGLYTASTKGCFDVIATATPLVLKEIEKQPIRPFGSPAFHIADYGTADGGTSLGLMTRMVEHVRTRVGKEDKEIVLHYEDQLT
jgi:hypothetical protein